MYMHTWLLWSNKPCVAVRGAGLELHVRPNLSDSVAERQLPPLALVKVNEMTFESMRLAAAGIMAAPAITFTLSNLVSPAATALLTGAFMVLASDDMAVDALPTVVTCATLGLRARDAQ